MLVHRRVTCSSKFAGTHLYTWVERGTVRVKCLAQEHNTMSLTRARTWTAQYEDEHTNHEVTTPLWSIGMLANNNWLTKINLPFSNRKLEKAWKSKCWRTWRIIFNTIQNVKNCIPQVQRIPQYCNSGLTLLKYCKKSCPILQTAMSPS